MPTLTLKLNITTIAEPRYLLQLQFTNYQSGFVNSIDFDGTAWSHTVWGKDFSIYLPAEMDAINYDYNFDDKLVIPGIWNFSLLDDNSILDELIFENNAEPLDVGEFYKPDLSRPVKVLLYKIGEHERFKFPLVTNHVPFFSGIVDMKSFNFDDFTKMISLTATPDIDLLKKTDMRAIKAARADAQEIPDTMLTMKENLFYLLQVALPNLTLDNIFIEHEFVFCAHSNPNLSHTSTNPDTIYAAGNIGSYTIHDLLFNPRDIAQRLGSISYPGNESLRSMTCHDLLKHLCFSFFAILTITQNKVVFSSINKAAHEGKTFNANRKAFGFTKEIVFERLEWIRITEVSANSHISHTIGTQSDLTHGFDKNIALVTIMNFVIVGGSTHYVLTSPFKVRTQGGVWLHVIFGKESTAATSYRTFRNLIATMWYDYMNKLTSGKIYTFQVDSCDIDFSYSLGYQDRLYTPVGLHYDIVDDSTMVEAVGN